MSSEPLQRIDRPVPVVERVYDSLRGSLLGGRFAAGQRLVEAELAARLGVSRTPIREAIFRLEAEGLVESLPNGGVAVRNLEADLADIYDLRQLLEGHATALAAQRISSEELAELEQANERLLEAPDDLPLERRAEINNTFHRLLIEGSHSPHLIRMVRSYQGYFTPRSMLGLYDYDRATALQVYQAHRAIVEALRRRDGELAQRLVREHFASMLAVVQSAVSADSGGPPVLGGHSEPARERQG
jgi:DNA-binding GntR family transcriptional regulator